MRQRPQEIVTAFAAAGHPAYFVDPTVDGAYEERGVRIVPSLRHVPGQGVLLYLHFAPLMARVELFDDPVIIYDILDDLSLVEAGEAGLPADATVAHHHPAAMAGADIVTVSAVELERRHLPERADLIRVDNGVDLLRFNPDGEREDFDQGPVIGFHGAVAGWFAFDLLEAVAGRRPDWHFVIVGPVEADVEAQAAGVARRCSNVVFAGIRSPDRIATAIRGFDVGVVWFEVNHMTAAVSPLKVYEWLACGVPPVSVPLPSANEEPIVRIAEDAEGMEHAIESALAGRANPAWSQSAADAARAATWERRIEPILGRLDELGRRTV